MKVTASICIIREIDTENSTVLLHIVDLGISERYGYDGSIEENLLGVKVKVIFHDGKVAKIEKIEEPSQAEEKKNK